MLQESTTDMPNNQSKYGRRFDEEFRREVAALASRPGAKLEQVARDLDVSPWSVSRWKKQDGGGPAGGGAPAATATSSPGTSVADLERRIKALERENADLREQRTILKKSSPSSPNSCDEAWRDQGTGVSARGAPTLPGLRRGA